MDILSYLATGTPINPKRLSDVCRVELGRILEEAGVENMDVTRLGTPHGISKLRDLLYQVRRDTDGGL